MRQIIFDTETTGLDPAHGHRIIEIGCVEMINRRVTGEVRHFYLNPERDIDEEAVRVHGLTTQFLADKPLFQDVVDDLLGFLGNAQLVAHNAPFDISFLNAELGRLGRSPITERCGVLDTVVLARQKHPGQRASLDALAKRYGLDHRDRTYHGALLDAQILADVYLVMTGGQVGLALGADDGDSGQAGAEAIRRLAADRPALRVIRAGTEELAAHEARLAVIDKASGGACLWRQLETTPSVE